MSRVDLESGLEIPQTDRNAMRFQIPKYVLLANALRGGAPEETIRVLESSIFNSGKGKKKELIQMRELAEEAWLGIQPKLEMLLDGSALARSQALMLVAQGGYNPYNELLVRRVYDSFDVPQPTREIAIVSNSVCSWEACEITTATRYRFSIQEIRRFALNGSDDPMSDLPIIRLDAIRS